MAWSIKLSKYRLTYNPRKAIKVHVLTDFVIKIIQKELEVGANQKE